jgi:hypothetical protein
MGERGPSFSRRAEKSDAERGRGAAGCFDRGSFLNRLLPRRAALAGAMLLSAAAGDRCRPGDIAMTRKHVEERLDGTDRPDARADRREAREREIARIEGFESVFGVKDEVVRRIVAETYPRGWADAASVASIRAKRLPDGEDGAVALFKGGSGPATIEIFPAAEDFGIDAVLGRELGYAVAPKTADIGDADRSTLLEAALGTPAGSEEEWEALVAVKLSSPDSKPKGEDEIGRDIARVRALLASSDPEFLPWEAAWERGNLIVGEYRRMNRERIDEALVRIPSGVLRVILRRRMEDQPSDLEEGAMTKLKGLDDAGVRGLPQDIVDDVRAANAKARTAFTHAIDGFSGSGGEAVVAYRALLEEIAAYDVSAKEGDPASMRARADGVIRSIDRFAEAFGRLPSGEGGSVERACAATMSERDALFETAGQRDL